MSRIVKEYPIRRNEILDAARTLVYTKGYEQMTIQDILDALQISKGAFYHYFQSKQDLLDALVERIMDEVEVFLNPIIEDPTLSAIEKMTLYFNNATRWKTTQKAFMLALLRIWYTDENAIFRQKMQVFGNQRVGPLLTKVVHQGNQEGVFNCPYPNHFSEILISLMQGVGEAFAVEILAETPRPGGFDRIKITLEAYSTAIERILGAPAGSFNMMDDQLLQEWFTETLPNSYS